jgi:hypothetical protein
MGIRDTIRDNAMNEGILRSGEHIQEVFPAQKTSPFWSLLTWLVVVIANGYRVVLVTNQRIIVCRGGRWLRSTITGVDRELPRETAIGPPKGVGWYRTKVLGGPLWIHRQFFKDVRAADGEDPEA